MRLYLETLPLVSDHEPDARLYMRAAPMGSTMDRLDELAAELGIDDEPDPEVSTLVDFYVR